MGASYQRRRACALASACQGAGCCPNLLRCSAARRQATTCLPPAPLPPARVGGGLPAAHSQPCRRGQARNFSTGVPVRRHPSMSSLCGTLEGTGAFLFGKLELRREAVMADSQDSGAQAPLPLPPVVTPTTIGDEPWVDPCSYENVRSRQVEGVEYRNQ